MLEPAYLLLKLEQLISLYKEVKKYLPESKECANISCDRCNHRFRDYHDGTSGCMDLIGHFMEALQECFSRVPPHTDITNWMHYCNDVYKLLQGYRRQK